MPAEGLLSNPPDPGESSARADDDLMQVDGGEAGPNGPAVPTSTGFPEGGSLSYKEVAARGKPPSSPGNASAVAPGGASAIAKQGQPAVAPSGASSGAVVAPSGASTETAVAPRGASADPTNPYALQPVAPDARVAFAWAKPERYELFDQGDVKPWHQPVGESESRARWKQWFGNFVDSYQYLDILVPNCRLGGLVRN